MKDKEKQREEVCAQFGVQWLPFRVVSFCIQHDCKTREDLEVAIKKHAKKGKNFGRYTIQQLRELAGMPQFRQVESGLKRRVEELEEVVKELITGRTLAFELACHLGAELEPIQGQSSNILRAGKCLSRLKELQALAENKKWIDSEIK